MEQSESCGHPDDAFYIPFLADGRGVVAATHRTEAATRHAVIRLAVFRRASDIKSAVLHAWVFDNVHTGRDPRRAPQPAIRERSKRNDRSKTGG